MRDQSILGADEALDWTDPLLSRVAQKHAPTGPVPLGIAAMHKVLSKTALEKYTRAAARGKGYIRNIAKSEFPDSGVDWDSLDNAIDILDQFGKLKTKKAGFHSVHRGDEFHAFSPYATLDELPDFEALAKRPLTDGEIERAYPGTATRLPLSTGNLSPRSTTASPSAIIGAKYNQFRSWWYKFAAESPENVMSRFPLYAHMYKQNYKEIRDRLKDSEGFITPELEHSARMSADRMARRDVGNVLFDMSNTSNLAHSLRFVSPFFGAWEDTMRKWWALSYDKPWVPARLTQVWHLPNAAGLVHDENGNEVRPDGSVVDPETGQVLKRKGASSASSVSSRSRRGLFRRPLKDATGIEDFKIRANSLDIIFGNQWWNPGAGPLVQVPTNEFVKHFWTNGENNGFVTNVVLGGMGVDPNDVPHQLMPAWWKPAFGNHRQLLRGAAGLLGSLQEHRRLRAVALQPGRAGQADAGRDHAQDPHDASAEDGHDVRFARFDDA
jgi:hypothetical protein